MKREDRVFERLLEAFAIACDASPGELGPQWVDLADALSEYVVNNTHELALRRALKDLP